MYRNALKTQIDELKACLERHVAICDVDLAAEQTFVLEQYRRRAEGVRAGRKLCKAKALRVLHGKATWREEEALLSLAIEQAVETGQLGRPQDDEPWQWFYRGQIHAFASLREILEAGPHWDGVENLIELTLIVNEWEVVNEREHVAVA